MRTIQRARARRFFCRRSRYANAPARRTVSAAGRYSLRRPPTYPLAFLRILLRRWRVLEPPFARGIARRPPSEVRHEHLQSALVRFRDQLALPETTAPLRPLRLQQMALPALVSLELPGGGLLEPLGRAPLRFHLRHARSPWLSVLRLGREDDVQHPSFHPRIVVDGGDVLHGLHHLLQHLPAELGVGHLAALEAHRHLRLVALVEEAAHVLHLEVEVVPLRLGAHLHFLDLDRRLLLARFLEAPGLRVLVLAEVHDPADGRLGLRRHFDQVELALARRLQRLLDRHDPELLAVGADRLRLPLLALRCAGPACARAPRARHERARALPGSLPRGGSAPARARAAAVGRAAAWCADRRPMKRTSESDHPPPTLSTT